MGKFARNEIISLVGAAPRFDLAESVGPDLRLGEIVGSAAVELADLKLGYGTAEGGAPLREVIANSHGVSPDDVVVTVGGMHALSLLAFTLCEHGDEAVAAAPLFPLARNALQAAAATTRTLPMTFDDCYQPDLTALRALLSPRTKLVSLASPQNPSGVAIPKQTLHNIVALMAEHAPQAWLLIDETYREAAYGNDPVAISAVALSPKVISVASLSKCHGAPGLRIGWAITRDSALREQLVLAKFNTVISCSPLDEAVALRLFERRDGIIDERRRWLSENLAVVAGWCRRNERYVEWVRPDAGALCCVRLRRSVFDDAAVERFYVALATKDTRVGRGNWFGEEARVFRLGFGLLQARELEAALARVSSALDYSARAAA